MEKLKIKPIKTIKEVRDCFAFFKRIVTKLSQTEIGIFSSFHETYQAMVDSVENKTKLQFYAEIDDKIVACIIAFPEEIRPKNLFLPVVVVDDKYRNLGIASLLLKELVKEAKPKGYSCLKVHCTPTFAGAFEKLGFTPYLYVEARPPLAVNDILYANNGGLELVDDDGRRWAKFKTNGYDISYLTPFKPLMKKINYLFIYEKNI